MVKAADQGPRAATANRLADGAVVFLAAGGAWSTDLQSAWIAATPEEAERLIQVAEAAAQRAEVVAPYLIAVAREADRWTPTNYRERIRAEGPSIGLPGAPAAA